MIMLRVIVPIASVLIMTVAFLAYYNFRVTGNALLMPHVLNQRTYVVVPLFRLAASQFPAAGLPESGVAQFLSRLGGVGISQYDCRRLCENDLDKIQEILGILLWADTQHPADCHPQGASG